MEQINQKIHYYERGFLNIIGILLILFIIFVVISLIGSSEKQMVETASTATVTEDKRLDRVSACIEAEDYIKQLLKAPATAKFPVEECSVTNLEDNKYKVVSYVDSQNSFGAMLRSNWSVIFQIINNNQQKKPIQVIFDGEIVYPVEESKAYKQQKANEQEAAKLEKEINKQLNLINSLSNDLTPSK